jgi:hypothetical protein
VTPREKFSAQTGKSLEAALMSPTRSPTYVPDAEKMAMELRDVLKYRKLNALTPYHPHAWASLLESLQLMSKYPHLVDMLCMGFHTGIEHISNTYTPNNCSSLTDYHDAFLNIIHTKFSKLRYIGLLNKEEVTSLIGPFQTSPLSLIPKPNKPGKFRLIQNFSYPHARNTSVQSINSNVISDLFPCTWGTFGTISLLIQ